jgi:hypothetical protein
MANSLSFALLSSADRGEWAFSGFSLPLPLAGEGRGEGLGRPENLLENSLGLRQDFVVPKSQDLIAHLRKVIRSGAVIRGGACVLSSIEFDDQTNLDTGEIGEVATNRALSTELQSEKLPIT